MLYLSKEDVEKSGVNWDETAEVIDQAVKAMAQNDYSQPIKPYLRYNDLSNRIIAMPAYVGGGIDLAGIKWIASFPKNIYKDKPRASSVVVLNNANTGEVEAIFNTVLTSIIRTASVSAFVVKNFFNRRKNVKNKTDIKVGIIGCGPIGQYHYKMISSILANRISTIHLFDINKIDEAKFENDPKLVNCSSWEEAYFDMDLVITCTVSDRPYINGSPKKNSLQLNVSLRDYTVDVFEHVKDGIVVDDWEEVCRENTDIEAMHLEKNLAKNDVLTIVDLLEHRIWDSSRFDHCMMFNPMGMAIFDISISKYLYDRAVKKGIGLKMS